MEAFIARVDEAVSHVQDFYEVREVLRRLTAPEAKDATDALSVAFQYRLYTAYDAAEPSSLDWGATIRPKQCGDSGGK